MTWVFWLHAFEWVCLVLRMWAGDLWCCFSNGDLGWFDRPKKEENKKQKEFPHLENSKLMLGLSLLFFWVLCWVIGFLCISLAVCVPPRGKGKEKEYLNEIEKE